MSVLLAFVSLAAAEWSCSRSSARTINQAVEALESGDPGRAEIIYRSVLQKDPDCGLARHGIGVAMLRQDRPEEAQEWLTELAGEYPEQSEALTALSVAAFAAQDFSTARTAALQAVGIDITSLEANAALLAVLLRQGELTLASQVIEEARGKLEGPTLACLEAQVLAEGGFTDQARVLLPYCRQSTQTALVAAISGQLTPGSRAAMADRVGVAAVAGIAEALDALNHGDPATARLILDGVLKDSPDRIDARIVRARASRSLGDLSAARTDLETIFEGESWIEVHTSGAMSGILLKSHEEKLSTLLSDGVGLLVDILLESGEVELARQQLTQATATLGAGPHLSAAEVRLLRATGEPEEGWRRLQVALTTWIDAPVLLTLAAEWGLAEPAALPEEAATALAASSRWEDRYNLAGIYHQSGRHPECVTEIRRAAGSGGPATDDASRLKLWQLGYRCAAQAQDLEAIEEAARRTGPLTTLDPTSRVNHALLRYSAGQGSAALEPLEALSGSPSVTLLAATITTRVHGEAGSWTPAINAAAGAPAAEQYWLGQRLVDAGKLAEGIDMLQTACPNLTDDERIRCTQLLVQINGAP